MRIHYGIQMYGQGHLNRSAEMIRRLRNRGHKVFVSASGETPAPYASKVLGKFQFYPVSSFHLQDGQLNPFLTTLNVLQSLPLRFQSTLSLRKQILKNRVDLILSDFDPLSAWAAALARIPAAGIAGQYRITRTNLENPSAPLDRALTHGLIEACSLGLDRYFAVSFCPAQATRPLTQIVGPILEESLYYLKPKQEDFFLVYLYSYPKEKILQTFASLPAKFRIYGLHVQEKHKNIQLCLTDRKNFIRDLGRCRAVILNGSFQAACEAAFLKKPILAFPFAHQYEELFNAFHIEKSGLGMFAEALNAESIHSFIFKKKFNPRSTLSEGTLEIIQALSL